jgi:arylsulfatase A-like enzyme
MTSMAVADRLQRDLAGAQRGDYVFAHLLLPHYPYRYDDTCSLLPVDSWMRRDLADAPAGQTNTVASRTARYAAYARQLHCVYRKLDEILEAIPAELADDAVIILQGDHGSRIVLVEPRLARASLMSATDYVDSYSTLFAVRSPRIATGYENREVPITCVLKTLVESNYGSLTGLDTCTTSPSVFVFDGSEAYPRPLPAFGHSTH